MQWTQLPDCPEWPMVGGLGSHWTQCWVEFFSEVEDQPPTHAHFYCRKAQLARAREAYQAARDKFPSTIKTWSHDPEPVVASVYEHRGRLVVIEADEAFTSEAWAERVKLKEFHSVREAWAWLHEQARTPEEDRHWLYRPRDLRRHKPDLTPALLFA